MLQAAVCSCWACRKTRKGFTSTRRTTRSSDALGSGIRVKPAVADDETQRFPSVMFPLCYFQTCDTFAAKGVVGKLVLDRSTILETKPPALTLAKTSPAAFARVGFGRALLKDMPTPAGRVSARRRWPSAARDTCS